jgi:2-phosphoglycerate kinase
MNKLYLIGGAPTTGKSTLAKKIAKYFDIPWISCDQIREFAQEILENYKDDFPDLYNDTEDVEIFFKKYVPKEIAELEYEQGVAFQIFLQKFVNKSYPWRSFIVEGVNILPECIKDIKFDGEIVPIFIVDKDADRARKVVYERGLWGPAKSYTDDVKEKEVEWVMEYSKMIISECEKCNYKCLEISKNDNDFDKILKEIIFLQTEVSHSV